MGVYERSDKLKPGLWEVRSHVPARLARILFTTVDGTMVLLHGFIKKSPKTPEPDLKLAERRLKEVQDEQA